MKRTAVFFLMLCVGCSQHSFTAKNGMLEASFRIKDAEQVSLYHSADGFQENKTGLKDGKWQTMIKKSEHFTYFLTVDGSIFLPDCEMKQQDDFGGEICIYERQE
ncbi:hypothetical protein ADMFC3_25480 [Geovibrio sp. ADMFC3]